MNDPKTALSREILAVERKEDFSLTGIATRWGHAPTWACTARLGQMPITADTAEVQTLRNLLLTERKTAEMATDFQVVLIGSLTFDVPLFCAVCELIGLRRWWHDPGNETNRDSPPRDEHNRRKLPARLIPNLMPVPPAGRLNREFELV